MTGRIPIRDEQRTNPLKAQTRTDATVSSDPTAHGENPCGFATIAGFSGTRPESHHAAPPSAVTASSDGRTPARWFLDLLDAAGSAALYDGSTTRQCPAHPDAHPSLSVGTGRSGQALLHCFAGCTLDAILAALACRQVYLYDPPPVSPADWARAFLPDLTFPAPSTRRGRSPQSRGLRLDAIHDYGPDHRVLRYRKGTTKEMFWETRHGNCWDPGLYGTPTSALPLYREPDVRMAVAAGEPVLLVESESSVDALRGWYSTTWAGGASAVQTARIASVLAGYEHLVVIPDNDPPGMACLARIRRARLAPHVVIPELGEDARDLLTRVGPDEFRALVNGALTP